MSALLRYIIISATVHESAEVHRSYQRGFDAATQRHTNAARISHPCLVIQLQYSTAATAVNPSSRRPTMTHFLIRSRGHHAPNTLKVDTKSCSYPYLRPASHTLHAILHNCMCIPMHMYMHMFICMPAPPTCLYTCIRKYARNYAHPNRHLIS